MERIPNRKDTAGNQRSVVPRTSGAITDEAPMQFMMSSSPTQAQQAQAQYGAPSQDTAGENKTIGALYGMLVRARG